MRSASVGSWRSERNWRKLCSFTTIGVRTVDGETTLAVIPVVAVSRAKVFTRPMTPHLEAV
jgi:hypothetical protein